MEGFNTILNALLAGNHLGRAQMSAVLSAMMEGRLSAVQLTAFLIALRMNGENADELTAAALTVRRFAAPVSSRVFRLVDTCGTGGDGLDTFNISTAAAIVAAAAGVRIAKHGNRAVSSNSGSADFLQAAGVDLTLDGEQVVSCIEQVGIGFLFAPQFHGAMKFAAPVRRELGVRTMFNLLGPLTNPLAAQIQLIGVYDAQWLERMAHAARALGVRRAMVVHGEDGMDEISIHAPTQIVELAQDTLRSYRIFPQDFDIQPSDFSALVVADAAASHALVAAVLRGEKGAARDIVCINAAAAIYLSDIATNMTQAFVAAQAAIDSGAAAKTLDRFAAKTRMFAKMRPT